MFLHDPFFGAHLKAILFLLFFTISFYSSAEVITHDISEGKHHKGGEIRIEALESSEDSFIAKISYKIKKKIYIPIGNSKLRGNVEQSLPAIFSDKEGYSYLEEVGSLKVTKATVKFIKRESIGKYYDSYKIQILPDNGKWKGYLWYHPSVSGVGWLKSELTLLGIPVLGDYGLTSFIQ